MTKLVLIDDNPDDREWLERLARTNDGFTIAAFETGAEGVSHIRNHGADCVLLDRRLGAEDGLAVLSRIRMATMFCPVIMLTGQEDETLAAAATRTGAARFLPKADLTAEVLTDAISDALLQAERRRERAGLSARTRHVLLIDDNADDRMQLRESIHDADPRVRVYEFAESRAAYDHLRERGGDCVLLDYRLQGEDGLAVLATLKAISPGLPVVMLTGQGDEEVAATAIRVGAADYRIKDRETGASLCAAVENAISRGALEARVAEQEEERRRFLNVLVHDLRAPLRHVGMMGELVLEEIERGEFDELKSHVGSLRATARRADGLIEALHAYALLDQDVSFEPTPLGDVAEAARENLSAYLSERRAAETIGELPTVTGNPPQLMQLLQNLIQNGVKYNDGGSPEVAIETEEAADFGEQSSIIVVRDNEIGIAEKHLRSIFAPLKRLWAREQYEGVGLGLATCAKIVERHGGSIWCTSAVDEGSAFHVRFPRMD